MKKRIKVIGIILLLIIVTMMMFSWSKLKPFDLDRAVLNGSVINTHGYITNLDNLDQFVEDVENGKDAEIEIVNFTVEGDPIIHVVRFKNNVIYYTLDSRHDEYGLLGVTKEKYDTLEVNKVFKNNIPYKEYKLVSGTSESIFFVYELGRADKLDSENEGTYVSAESDKSGLVELLKMNDKVWVHRTYYDYNGVQVSSNGLVVITSDMLVMVDTPWTNEQTEILITLAEEQFDKTFGLAFVTHAHIDRMGGIDTLLDKGINVQSSRLTIDEAEKNGFSKPEYMLKDKIYIPIRGQVFEFYYPGEGHTKDNMVLWLPDSKILYGACIVKSLESKTLGSIVDANLEQWPQSLNNLKARYPNANSVIPGHGQWGGVELIDHTLMLLSENESFGNDTISEMSNKQVIEAINNTAFSEKYEFDCILGEYKFSGVQVKENDFNSDFKLAIYLKDSVECIDDVMIQSWGRGYKDFNENYSFSASALTQRDMKGIGPSLTDFPITQINRFAITKDRRKAIDQIVKLEESKESTSSYLITFVEESEWSQQEMYVEVDMTTYLLKSVKMNNEPNDYGNRNYTLFIDQVKLK